MDKFGERLASAKNNDRQSIEVIISDFGWVVDAECYRFVSNFGPDVSTADLKQEVWMKVWGNIEQFRINGSQNVQGQFVAWLRIVARRVLLGLDRKARNATRSPRQGLASLGDIRDDLPTCDYEMSPSSVVAGIEEANRLRKAVDGLPSEEMKAVIHCCFIDGLSLKQAADRLELTYDQVRYRFHAALQELERRLG